MCGLTCAQHFLQRFPPGADRFAGVDSFTAGNGSPALAAAVAHLECKVVSAARDARPLDHVRARHSRRCRRC